MTDKEIALELVKAFLQHKNEQTKAGHNHTDLGEADVQDIYMYFYQTVSNIDGK